MNKKYVELFTQLSQVTANLAEQVMEQHKVNNDEKGYKTAEVMRNDYLNLREKLESNQELLKPDYARLLIAAIIFTNQLESKVTNEQKVLQAYKIDLIPKLDQINNIEPEKVPDLAIHLFYVEDENNEDN